MCIALNSNHVITHDFNNVGMPTETGKVAQSKPSKVDNGGNAGEIVHKLTNSASKIDGAKVLKNATVEGLAEKLRDLVPARHTRFKSFKNFFKTIGRAVMKTCHAIRNGFAFAPAKRSRAEFQARINHSENAVSHVGTWNNRPHDLCSFDTKLIGAAMGLREGLRAEPFTNDEIEGIRKGQFKISDITQDPNFENCWFLGSLASFLTAKGPVAIQELISLPPPGGEWSQDNPPMAQVKLGGEIYEVPLAELRDNRGSGVSTSAPWVKLMETAMQMHVVNLTAKGVILQGQQPIPEEQQPIPEQQNHAYVDMAFGLPGFALHTLLNQGVTQPERYKNSHKVPAELDPRGVSIIKMDAQSLLRNHQRENTSEANHITEADCATEIIAQILHARQNHRTVILTTDDSHWVSLGSGISPNHTVSIQDVVTKKDGTCYFQIFDPYNRSVSISSDILLNGGAIVMEKDPGK